MGKAAISSYADFEQLAGGAELMFGEAYDYVAEKAANAYSTVQLSQNEYLQQVNGFATGLKMALGGNEQAAAELADRIVKAEADIVAATGNTAENVQNAFNGIMKSNYTMLDNLQIGITPTKEGFQEVIDKVNEWNTANGNATKYQIENLADCQSALIDYIDMVGYSGYAQNEAAGTIQGSLAATKAAWSNLLTGIATDNANIPDLAQKFTESAADLKDNLVPRVKEVIKSLIPALEEVAQGFYDMIPEEVRNKIETFVTVMQMIAPVAGAAAGAIMSMYVYLKALLIVEKVQTGIKSLTAGIKLLTTAFKVIPGLGIVTLIGTIVAALATLYATNEKFRNLVNSVLSVVMGKVQEVVAKVQAVAFTIKGKLDEIWAKVQEVVELIRPYIDDAIETIKTVVSSVMEDLTPIIDNMGLAFSNAWSLAQTAFDLIQTGIAALVEAAQPYIEKISEFFSTAWEAVKAIWALAQPFFELIWYGIQTIFSVVGAVLGGFFYAAWEAIKLVWDAATGFFAMIWETIATVFEVVEDVLSGDFQGAWDAIQELLSDWGAYFADLWQQVQDAFADVLTFFADVGSNIIDGLTEGWNKKWDDFKTMVSNAWDGLKSIFTIDQSDVKIGGAGRSHAGGLDYVPYNNYAANLHRGEMVLTADEAAQYRRGASASGGGFTVNQTIYAAKQSAVELAAATEAYFQRARWAIV